MAEGVRAGSPQTLRDLRATLLRVRADVQGAVGDAEVSLRRTEEVLNERRYHWECEVRRWRDEERKAAADLASCRTRTTRNGQKPDCSAEQRALELARSMLRQAEGELANVRRWAANVEEAASEYRRQAGRLRRWLEGDLENAASFLTGRAQALEGYLLVADAVAHGLAASLGGIGPGGIEEVPLCVVEEDGTQVQGEEDFQKASAASVAGALEKLESTVRPAVAAGADGEYFSRLDTEQGLEYANGYRRVFDTFWGNDPIRLDWRGNGYHVLSGEHRIFMARELGFGSLPALIDRGK